jgi:hypothetical protein
MDLDSAGHNGCGLNSKRHFAQFFSIVQVPRTFYCLAGHIRHFYDFFHATYHKRLPLILFFLPFKT